MYNYGAILSWVDSGNAAQPSTTSKFPGLNCLSLTLGLQLENQVTVFSCHVQAFLYLHTQR